METTNRRTSLNRMPRTAALSALALLVVLVPAAGVLVLADDEKNVALDVADDPEIGAPVTPYVFDGDLRDLPAPTLWKPGDPIKEIPRRFYPPPGTADQYTGSEEPYVDLLNRDQLVAPNHTTAAFTTPSRSFPGQGYTGVNPPDTVGDVGLNYYFQAVNSGGGSEIRVFDKAEPTPNVVANFSLDSLGSGNCASGFGDPIIIYDRFADRWLLSEFSNSGNRLCVYISQTSDPISGGWYNYDHQAPSFPDYPKYGVWPTDAGGGLGSYVVTANDGGPGIYMLDRGAMLGGSPGTYRRLTIPRLSGFGFQTPTPADLDGMNAPPTGAAAIIMRQRDTENHGGPAAPGDLLEMWAFDIDWTNPDSATLTTLPSIDVAEFDSALCGLTAFFCFPMPGTGQTLDPLREVIMNRLQYYNHGDYETLTGNFVTDLNGQDHGGVRWFELRREGGGGWSLFQEGTYSIDSDHRFMAASAMDQSGNIALAYSVTSSSTFPSLRYTGRLATDPLGVMTQAESSIHEGTASNSSNRWGDYGSMNLDPVDDCTFWFTSLDSTSSNWRTQIASFGFDACGCELFPAPPTADSATNGDNQIDLTWNDSELATVVEYRVRRSFSSGGPYDTIAVIPDSSPGVGNGAGYGYSDDDVSGDVTYYYVIEASDGLACTSDASNETNSTATGACTLHPLFAGIESVSTPYLSTCTLDLEWSPATARCAGPLVYNVYRSEIPGFTPDGTNLLAFGLGGTQFTDIDAIADGTPYYYVVRAVDQDAGADDGNLAEIVGIAKGPLTTGTWYDDGGDTGFAKMIPSSPWQLNGTEGNVGPKVYKTGTYGDDVCSGLTTPALQLGAGSILTFSSKYEIEPGWDKGEVQVSTDGGSNWERVELAYPGNSTREADACDLPTGDFFTGTDGTYQNYTADLSAWNGQVVLLRFALSTDGSVDRPGWWIDDIEITNVDVPGECFPGSACPDNPFVNVAPDGPLAACEGDAQILTAGLSGGSGPFHYQWIEDGVDMPGENDPTLAASNTDSHSYNARVRGDSCENGTTDNASTEVYWTGTPTFDGVGSATNRQQPICTVDLGWEPADSLCPGPITYAVYRDTESPVAVTPANRIAVGVSGTTYQDTYNLVNGVQYYYVVRAVESSNGQSDGNTAEEWAIPTGVFLNTCATEGAPGPPPAPNGEGGTQPLNGELISGPFNVLGVTWDATSCPASTYNLLYGRLDDVAAYSLLGSKCAIGNSGSYTWAGAPTQDLFFLVVGTNGAGIESSWGTDSNLVERNGAAASGVCAIDLKETTGTCP